MDFSTKGRAILYFPKIRYDDMREDGMGEDEMRWDEIKWDKDNSYKY